MGTSQADQADSEDELSARLNPIEAAKESALSIGGKVLQLDLRRAVTTLIAVVNPHEPTPEEYMASPENEDE